MALDWKVISQRNWVKGLQATFARFAQPQGILVRLVNLLYDLRGGLRTSDGSLVFSQQNGISQVQGRILELTLYSPTGVPPYYVDIQSNILTGAQIYPVIVANQATVGGQIATAALAAGVVTITTVAAHNLVANPVTNGTLSQAANSNAFFNTYVPLRTLTIVSTTKYSYLSTQTGTQSGTGGVINTQFAPSTATLTYSVTSVDGQGGETPTLNNGSTSLSGAQNAVLVTWTAVPLALGYNVYGRTFLGTTQRLNTAPVNGLSYLDLGDTPLGPAMPVQNTSQASYVYTLQPPTGATLIGQFPTYYAPPLGGIPGTTDNTMGVVSGTASPSGGVIGATGPLPQIVQFANMLIFALGNGYAPQQFLDQDPTGNLIIPVPNNFTAAYTDWQASVVWNQGDTIKDSVSGGVYQAIQGGTSGATRPAFVDTLNATTPEVSPGTVVWKCTAVHFTGTPLRGAAHAVVYAGSLWLANTWPVTTPDFLDGPTCIKMCDVNNPSSWNPANVAFLGKDDGDQITGLATYTIGEAGIAPTGSLVIFKTFKTFQITGVFGASDFTIQDAQTDLGNLAPRSSSFIPGFGIMRLTHLGFAYFNGVNDKLTSEEIRPYLFGGQDDIQPIDFNYAYFSKGAQSANPPMYLCACPIAVTLLTGLQIGSASSGTIPLYVRVIELTQGEGGNWEETASSGEQVVYCDVTPGVFLVTPAAQPGVKYRIFAGYSPNGENVYIEADAFNGSYFITSFSPGLTSYGAGGLQRLFCYDLVMKQWAIIDLPFPISVLKQIRSPGNIPLTVAAGASDGELRRLLAGDEDWDNGDPVSWSFRSAELFQQGGSAKVFYRRLVVRGSGDIPGSVTVTLTLQGDPQTPVTQPVDLLGSDQWELRVDILKDAANANAELSGDGPVRVVLEAMDWYVKPKASGAPTSIQKRTPQPRPVVTTPGFTVGVSPNSILLVPGGGGTLATVTMNAVAGFTSPVTITFTGLPSGVTVNPTSATVFPGVPTPFTFTADNTATPGGPTAINVTGTSGLLINAASLAITIGNVPDFLLFASPPTVALTGGGAGSVVSVLATSLNGLTGNVAVTFSGLPTGVTASPSSLSLVLGIAQNVTLTANSSAPASTGVITVTGINGSKTHTAPIAISVTAAPIPDFVLTRSPSSVALTGGTTGSVVSYLATAVNGLTGNVAVTFSGLPSGVTASPSSLSLVFGVAQNVTFTASSSAPTSTGVITATGVNGSKTHSVPVTATVTAGSTVIVAPAAAGEPLNSRFTVLAGGLNAPVYNAAVLRLTNPSTSLTATTAGVSGLCSFSMVGTPPVVITYTSAVTSAQVFALGLPTIPTVISGNTVSFTPPSTGVYMVEVNNDIDNSLQIKANPPASPPTPGATVLILPPGQVFMNQVDLTSTVRTLYVPDGTILYANNAGINHFINVFGSNVKVIGFGIIDGSLSATSQNLIYAYQAPGLVIDGPILRRGTSFHCFINNTNGFTINNTWTIGNLLNADGFDIANCQNWNINYCYGRNFDDIFVVKATSGGSALTGANGNVTGCCAWNCVAHAFSIGNETVLNIDGTTFNMCSVFRDYSRVGTLGLYCGDSPSGALTNSRWANISMYMTQYPLNAQVNGTFGSASNLVFTNISMPLHSMTGPTVYGQTTPVSVLGNSASHAIAGVAFTNWRENGVLLTVAGVTHNAFTTGITAV